MKLELNPKKKLSAFTQIWVCFFQVKSPGNIKKVFFASQNRGKLSLVGSSYFVPRNKGGFKGLNLLDLLEKGGYFPFVISGKRGVFFMAGNAGGYPISF